MNSLVNPAFSGSRAWVMAICVLLFLITPDTAWPHRPHDDIQHLEFLTSADRAPVGLAVIRNNLMRAEGEMSSWVRVMNGLTNRYGITGILASETNSGTAFVSAAYDGVYVTDDFGLSWRPINKGLNDSNVHLLAAGHNQADTLLAASEEGNLLLYGREHGWRPVANAQSGFSAATFIDGSIAYAGTHDGELFRSIDDGNSWELLWNTEDAIGITTIEASPEVRDDGTIFVGTSGGGIYRTTDTGATYERMINGEHRVTDVEVSSDFGSNGTVYATTWNGVLLSRDAGRTWFEANNGLTQSSQADSDAYLSPHFRSIITVDEGLGQDTVFVGGFDGLFRSENNGESWEELQTLPADLLMSFAVSEPDADGLHTIAIGTYGAGTAISLDEGRSWAMENSGLHDTRIRDLSFPTDYQQSGQVFVTTKATLAHKKLPEAEWHTVTLKQGSLVSSFLNLIRPPIEKLMRSSEAFSSFMNKYAPRPSGGYTIHPTVTVLSSDFNQNPLMLIGTAKNGLFLSSDRGKSFTRLWESWSKEVTAIALSPDYPQDGTLFVGLSEFHEPPKPDSATALLKSDDAASSFSEVGFDNYEPNGRLQVVLSPGFKTDHTIFAASLSGLVVSRDGGSNWQQPVGPRAAINGPVTDLAVSPDYPSDGTVLISVKGVGLFMSTDHGASFDSIADQLVATNRIPSNLYSFPATSAAIKFSPTYADSRTIFATTGLELIRSVDGGETWHTMSLPAIPVEHR